MFKCLYINMYQFAPTIKFDSLFSIEFPDNATLLNVA